MTNYRTLVTATDKSLPMIEVVSGHFVHQVRQHRWAGEASGPVIAKWLRENNLESGFATVYFYSKGRSVASYDFKVIA